MRLELNQKEEGMGTKMELQNTPIADFNVKEKESMNWDNTH